jgi:tetratricopeptide (TPR) repeat protein
MNTIRIVPALLVVMIFIVTSCSQTREEKAFDVFNEGVTLSLTAHQYGESGRTKEANDLLTRAIEKYKETLRIDSTHGLARSVLGHSYYLLKKYREGVYWFEQANKLDTPMAQNYREMGLCKINMGQIPAGWQDLKRAFAIDGGKEIREATIADLTDIGHLAFEYGKAYEAEGAKEKGITYKRFSIGVLLTAFDIDTTKKEIAATISQYAEKIGEKSTAERYREIAGR